MVVSRAFEGVQGWRLGMRVAGWRLRLEAEGWRLEAGVFGWPGFGYIRSVSIFVAKCFKSFKIIAHGVTEPMQEFWSHPFCRPMFPAILLRIGF